VIKIEEYLKPNGISNLEARFMFMIRTRMLDVKTKYGDSTTVHRHMSSVCKELDSPGTLVEKLPSYEHIFEGSLDEKVYIGRILRLKFSQRNKKVKLSENKRK
jgi:hypothetical protein